MYSGARRCIGNIVEYWRTPRVCSRCWGLLGVSGDVRGVRGVLGAGRDCRYSGARRV